ncbi:hypothetical protein P3T76_013894 [Phytophthora citrophthora]|uniref:Uncharacterized protein n=1 Tax=Phytophthora citrophthora TaxID=4793 RepID=A0AAD9G254_9STRA|nr:hypothetical protein P3T76_013894 [Phytophthora citrophthora]
MHLRVLHTDPEITHSGPQAVAEVTEKEATAAADDAEVDSLGEEDEYHLVPCNTTVDTTALSPDSPVQVTNLDSLFGSSDNKSSGENVEGQSDQPPDVDTEASDGGDLNNVYGSDDPDDFGDLGSEDEPEIDDIVNEDESYGGDDVTKGEIDEHESEEDDHNSPGVIAERPLQMVI